MKISLGLWRKHFSPYYRTRNFVIFVGVISIYSSSYLDQQMNVVKGFLLSWFWNFFYPHLVRSTVVLIQYNFGCGLGTVQRSVGKISMRISNWKTNKSL